MVEEPLFDNWKLKQKIKEEIKLGKQKTLWQNTKEEE